MDGPSDQSRRRYEINIKHLPKRRGWHLTISASGKTRDEAVEQIQVATRVVRADLAGEYVGLLAELGASLQHERERRGLTQQDLSERSGLAHTTINNLERGSGLIGSYSRAFMALASIH